MTSWPTTRSSATGCEDLRSQGGPGGLGDEAGAALVGVDDVPEDGVLLAVEGVAEVDHLGREVLAEGLGDRDPGGGAGRGAVDEVALALDRALGEHRGLEPEGDV